MNIEGVARQLDPKLDLFAVAKPVLETILRERYSPATLMAELQKRMPEIISQTPDMPGLIRNWFDQQVSGEHSLRMHSEELAELARQAKQGHYRVACLILAVGFLICAVLFYLFDTHSPIYFNLNAKTWAAIVISAFALLAAWFKKA